MYLMYDAPSPPSLLPTLLATHSHTPAATALPTLGAEQAMRHICACPHPPPKSHPQNTADATAPPTLSAEQAQGHLCVETNASHTMHLPQTKPTHPPTSTHLRPQRLPYLRSSLLYALVRFAQGSRDLVCQAGGFTEGSTDGEA
eukprot:569646-Pelagomonas_calceolata.AAC.2